MTDLVVYGATGFVGELVARHLADHAPAGTTIALAGRSAEKLAAVRDRLGVDWPVVVADAADPAALDAMVARARVVVTTVGPYAKYGRRLAHACAKAGVDYVDLTGEVLFVRDSIDENHDLAAKTGARIVHSCGFDSVPSDLGVHVLHKAAHEELTDTLLVVTSMRGGVSGGTIDSMRAQLDEMRADKRKRKIATSPYSLSPDRAAEPDLGRQSDSETIPASAADPRLKGRLAPFFMASYNTRIVRRSNALRGFEYGRRFRYREAMRVGSPLAAVGVQAGLGALLVGMTLPPTRFLLDRLLPKPGAGPSESVRRNGHFTTDFFTTTVSGARYHARIRAKGDPGYAATAVMLGESALSLLDADALPPSPGGVLTPATALGDVLVERLRGAGFEIRARKVR